MNKIDKLISIIRNLKEDGMSVAVTPTNNTGSGPEGAGYSSTGDQEHAGYDKLLSRGKTNLMRRFFAKKRKLNKSKTNK
jgi:hypothetical protein